MASGYSVTMTCKVCGGSTGAITGTTEASGAKHDALKMNRMIQCDRCGAQAPFKFAIVAVTHSGAVGSNTTITNTVTNGSSSTAVS